MIITIYEGYDKSYIMLGSKNKEFHKAYGSMVRVSTSGIYPVLADITRWCNNELGEECLFEVD